MRRLAIASATLIAIGTMVLLANDREAAAGTIPCREVYGAGGGYVCGAEVETHMMNSVYKAAKTQSGCWAESMAMIIKFNGVEVPSSDILSATFGASVPDALPPAQAQTYLNHNFTSSVEHSVATTTATALYTAPIGGSRPALRSLAGQLTGETPLLIFTSRNAMVLTAIYYHADIFSRPKDLYAAVVRDPCPNQPPAASLFHVSLNGHPGERLLSPQEFNDIQSVFQVTVTNH